MVDEEKGMRGMNGNKEKGFSMISAYTGRLSFSDV
jgi:hypothetical protein